MQKQDDKDWQKLLANLNPYRQSDATGKGSWRPELQKKIVEYERVKGAKTVDEEQPFSWLFEEDAPYIDNPNARAKFDETETTIYNGVPAGPIELDPQKAQIYIANINPAVASGQVEELNRAKRDGGSVNIQAYMKAEDATWIDGKPAENILYHQLFETQPAVQDKNSLTEYLQLHTKQDKQHWHAQHASMLLCALFHADDKKKTSMSVSEAKEILRHYPIQFIDLLPYRTQNADDFLKFIESKSTSDYQMQSVEAYQAVIGKQKNFKALPNGAKVALLPSTQYVIASVIERIRQYVEDPVNISAPTFVLRSYKNWWQPALQIFLTNEWDSLPASLRAKASNVVTLLQALEKEFFWTYVSSQNASISANNLKKVHGKKDEVKFLQTFVEPFQP